MRNRSKSLAIELSSKFEQDVLEIDDELEEEESEYVEPAGTPVIAPDHIAEQVIEKVLASLPNNDSMGYTKTLKRIKWDEIQVDGCKPEDVEKVFYHAIKDVNKTRTLTEIVNDAKHRMNSFHQHPDHPKRPKTLFAMFVQERFKQIKEENPEIENNDVMRKCSEEFKTLSEKKKHKLKTKHAVLLEDYNDRMAKYRLKHPELQQGGIKNRSRPKMTTPLAFYWAQRNKELGRSDMKTYQKVRKDWTSLDVKKKAIYIRQFFNATEEKCLSKSDRRSFLEAKGAPTRPGTAFGVFMQEHQQKYKHLNAQERMKQIAELWSRIDPPIKERYTHEANVEMELYMQKWKKFTKSLTKEEQKWIELPKPGTKRKRVVEDTETEDPDLDETPKIDNKKQKTNTSTVPEPQKPTEDVITYYADKKLNGDRKEAKKKWKTLKESKQAKYTRQLENLQATYFEDLKAYLKSLSADEVKEYKKRMKMHVKDEDSD